MNVLVVGGAGYIGGAVTDLLLERGENVRVYDALLYEESYRRPVDFVYGDVRDPKRLAPHLKWADAVIWLAALVGDAACALNPDITVEINQHSVRWLSEIFDGRIVFTSTCSVYGAQYDVLDENSPTSPLSEYALTKLEAERCLSSKNAIILRLGTLFGIGDVFSRIRLDLVVNSLTVKAHRVGKITVYGGDQYRPLLHVRDAAQAAVDALTVDRPGLFNLRKDNVRISDLAEELRAFFPDLIVERTPRKFEDTRNYRVSDDKARRVLGFKPTRSVAEGIEEMKALLDSKRLKDPESPRHSNHLFLSMYDTHVRQ